MVNVALLIFRNFVANGNGVNDYDSGDRVSASSGIASANSSSMPWLHLDTDQELSGSSGECEQQLQQLQLHHQLQQQQQQQQQGGSFRNRSRRSSRNGSARRAHQHHQQRLQSQLQQARSEVHQPPLAPSPLSSEATTAASSSLQQRLPSPEQSCLTETTDCPSEVSVLTSISTVKNNGGGRGKQHPRAQQGVVNAGASLSCEDLDGIQVRIGTCTMCTYALKSTF